MVVSAAVAPAAAAAAAAGGDSPSSPEECCGSHRRRRPDWVSSAARSSASMRRAPQLGFVGHETDDSPGDMWRVELHLQTDASSPAASAAVRTAGHQGSNWQQLVGMA